MKTVFDTPKQEPSTLDYSGKRNSLISSAISELCGNLSGKTHAIIERDLFGSVPWNDGDFGYIGALVASMTAPKYHYFKTTFTHDKKGDRGTIRPAL